MATNLDDVEKAELTKICSEINQLQNQRFTLVLAALTFVGVSGGWMFQVKEFAGSCIVAATVLSALTALSFWLTRLGNQVVRLSIYLEERFDSAFERHHATFSLDGHARSSQTTTQFQLIGAFGLVAFALPFLVWFASRAKLGPSFGAGLVFLIVASAVFAWMLLFFTQRNRRLDREMIRRSWRAAIAEVHHRRPSDLPPRGTAPASKEANGALSDPAGSPPMQVR